MNTHSTSSEILHTTVPSWLHFRSPGKPYRSVTRHWGGLITIWRGGLAHEYRATLSSYRRIRRLLRVSA